MCQLLITLISQISRCMMLKPKLQGASAFSLNCSNMVSLIEAKCTELFTDDVSLSTKTCFIGQLQPSWLSYRILDWILSKYNQCLIKGKHKQLLKKPLSLNKIVSFHYLVKICKEPAKSLLLWLENPKIACVFYSLYVVVVDLYFK